MTQSCRKSRKGKWLGLLIKNKTLTLISTPWISTLKSQRAAFDGLVDGARLFSTNEPYTLVNARRYLSSRWALFVYPLILQGFTSLLFPSRNSLVRESLIGGPNLTLWVTPGPYLKGPKLLDSLINSWIKRVFPLTTITSSHRFARPSSSEKTATATEASTGPIVRPS